MKIYCDFCGAQIETSVNKTCPNCGGYYSNDSELLEEKERVKRLNELDMEKKELEIERIRLENKQIAPQRWSPNKTAKMGCLLPVVIGLAILGIFFVMIILGVTFEAISEGGSEASENTTAQTSRISVSYSFSMEPINIPEIPEVPEITTINLVPEHFEQ